MIDYMSTLKTAFKSTTNNYCPLCKSDRKLGGSYLSEYLLKSKDKNSFEKPGVCRFDFYYSLSKI